MALLVVAAAVGTGVAFSLWKQDRAQGALAAERLEEARAALAEAMDASKREASRNRFTHAARLAQEAAAADESCSLEALRIEAQAWIGTTQFRRAIEVLERGLALHPGDTEMLDLSAQAFHKSYEATRKGTDLAGAFAAYDELLRSQPSADRLLSAGSLAELAGQPSVADSYFDRLAREYTNTAQAETAAALRAARTSNDKQKPQPEDQR
ncbi:MAG: hypothetical protein JNJ88_11235 [Planctomycetes bacterium]|nr:hypothetical protein [Planctomycetota bacterium]